MATISDYRSVLPTFAIDNKSSTLRQEFSFVTIQNPGELKQKARQSQIRKHAKRDVDRARAQKLRAAIQPLVLPKTPRPTERSILSASSNVDSKEHLSEVSTEHAVDSALDELDVDGIDGAYELSMPLSYLRPIGAGRGFVPFALYPVEPTPRMVMLFDYMLEAERLHHRHVRMLWITIAMFDRDSFNVTLAHASNLLAKHQGLGYFETAESIHFYTITVQAVSKRLASPTENTTDGVIGTILGLACLDISYANWKRWRTHIDGIRRILLLRGGLNTVHTSLENSMTAFWNDMSGSLVLDREPSFPVSAYIQPRVPPLNHRQREQYKQRWRLATPMLSTIGDMFADLGNMMAFADGEQVGTRRSQQEGFIAHDLNPLVHKLLSLPRLTVEEDLGKNSKPKIHETLRLALLLLVGLIKQFYRIGTTGLKENHKRLITLLDNSAIDWTGHHELQLWTFVLAAITAGDDFSTHVQQLLYIARQQSLSGWGELHGVVKAILWSDKILALEVEAVSREVDNHTSAS